MSNEYPKSFDNNVYPVLSNATSSLMVRIEPILTPEKLVSRYLKGLPLKDYSTDDFKDKIDLAFNEAELILDLSLTPVKRKEKHPFDYQLYKNFVHTMTNFGPILQVDKLSINSSNNVEIFVIPASWIEAARFFQKQINVVPLTVVGATGVSNGQATGAAGLAFLAAMQGGLSWVPSYWQVEYTTGVCNKEGHLPLVINELIGTIAAIEILGNLGPNNANTSVSISHDGLSQASSNPGPAIYQTRIGELTAKKDDLIKKIRRIFYNKYYMSNI